MKPVALLVVLLVPGLGLGADAVCARRRLLAALGFGAALAEVCNALAAALQAPRAPHAAAAALGWLIPVLAGVVESRRDRRLRRALRA